MRELVITVQEAGQRLDRYLSRVLPKASSGFLHKMIRNKNIKLNGEKAAGSERLQKGDRIQIYFSEETMEKFGAGRTAGKGISPAVRPGKPDSGHKGLRDQVKLLYQDEDVLILHKPAGMLTQKARPGDDSLNDYLLDYWREEIMKGREVSCVFRPSVANRLDRNTSGIVLCGITVKGLQSLSFLLKNRALEKYYLCIVRGEVTGSRKLRGYLKKDSRDNMVKVYSRPVPNAAPIETWYRSVDHNEKASLLKVRLITGKSHQIRAHLASAGYPLLGDAKYGDPEANRHLVKAGLGCQQLHSSELVIPEECGKEAGSLRGLHIKDKVPGGFMRALELYGLELKEEE